MRNHSLSMLVALLLLPVAGAQSGDLTGRVSASGADVPIPGATVVLNPLGAVQRTDSSGHFHFSNVPAGQYQIVTTAERALVYKSKVRVPTEGAHLSVEVTSGDLNQDGHIDLVDAALFTRRFGSVSAGHPLDMDGDRTISAADLDMWYVTNWQKTGHWYRYRLLDDAEQGGSQIVYPARGRWQTFHDDGSSLTVPEAGEPVVPAEGGYFSEHSVQFEYMLGSRARYPFALIRLLFGQDEEQSLDARKYVGLMVALKGQRQPLIVSLKSAVTSDDWAEYFVRIPEVPEQWTVFKFTFRSHFRQPGWGERESIEEVLRTLQAIQFKADQDSMGVRRKVWIDNLCLLETVYPPPSTHVVGRVVSEQGEPLPAAIVSLTGLENEHLALSGLDGAFSLSNVEPGEYLFKAMRPGFEEVSFNVTVPETDELDLGELQVQRVVPVPKPISTGPVRVVGHKLEVDFDRDGVYEPFFIKGVGYSPTPIGSWGDLIYPERVYSRDMPLLQAMHCNTVRTWSRVNHLLLDKAEEHGIKVIAGFPVSSSADFFNPVDRLLIQEEFREYVSEYKAHPAVLAWALGNEQNYTNGENWAWYSLVEDLAVLAYLEEGAAYHPVATPNGDRYCIGFRDYLTRDDDIPYLDIWGMNLYKSDNEGFGPTFVLYSAFSDKPLWISEYGIDAYDNRNHVEYEEVQAHFAANRLREMIASPICVGSTLMAYSDEWWKAGNPYSHDLGGYPTNAHPDGFSNEEWWGIFRVAKNDNDIDLVIKRAIYDTLRSIFSQMEPDAK